MKTRFSPKTTEHVLAQIFREKSRYESAKKQLDPEFITFFSGLIKWRLLVLHVSKVG